MELHTSGDLRLVDKPDSIALGPHESKQIQTSLKVSSTESGVIFGNMAYNFTGATTDRNIVVMNGIHMDIMDYIEPAYCGNSKFSDMWSEFEWENKIPVNTDITTLNGYLDHILSITNMACLTPKNILDGKCQFLAANLYARSIFGEDALLNLSIVIGDDGKISGYVRIRSKTQGIALSLGDKIIEKQRYSSKNS